MSSNVSNSYSFLLSNWVCFQMNFEFDWNFVLWRDRIMCILIKYLLHWRCVTATHSLSKNQLIRTQQFSVCRQNCAIRCTFHSIWWTLERWPDQWYPDWHTAAPCKLNESGNKKAPKHSENVLLLGIKWCASYLLQKFFVRRHRLLPEHVVVVGTWRRGMARLKYNTCVFQKVFTYNE